MICITRHCEKAKAGIFIDMIRAVAVNNNLSSVTGEKISPTIVGMMPEVRLTATETRSILML
jgi:hypothetical protein